MKHFNILNKKYLAVLLLLVVIGVSGCGKQDTESVDSSELESQVSGQDMLAEEPEKIDYEECTLTFSGWGEEEQQSALKKVIKAFEEEYPGIEVELSYSKKAEFEEQLQQQFTEGNVSDVVQITEDWLYELSAEDKLFTDLYYQEEVLELVAFNQKLLDRCTMKERLQMLPATLNGKMLLWNETLFQKAGIRVPKTVVQLKNAGTTFASKLGESYYPLAMDLQDRMNFLVYYLEAMYGKNWIVDGVLQYRVEEIADGLEFIQSLEEAHVIPPLNSMSRDEESSVSVEGGWREGTYAGAFIWSNQLKEYEDNVPSGAKVAADEVLVSMGGYHGGYAKVEKAYAISENCEHKREASLFMNYLLNHEDAASVMEKLNGVPLSEKSLEICKEENLISELEDTIAEQVQKQVVFRLEPKLERLMNQDAEENCSAIIRGFFYGDYNATEAAQLLTDKIQNAYQ